MKTIPLTQGKFAIVDDDDYPELSRSKWYASYSKTGGWVVRREVRGRQVKMSRILLRAPVGVQVDHANRDPFDNRRFNLRRCTPSQNSCNRRVRSDNPIGFKGIRWARRGFKHFRADITARPGVRIYLGRFLTLTEAVRAYNKAAIRYHGEFACLNQTENGG